MITTEERGALGLITLDRPTKLNALSPEMYGGLAEALRGYDARDDVAVIVVRGAGSHFTSGNDVAEFLSDDGVLLDPARSPAADAVDALLSIDTPLIAAVEGCAIGFGATMLLHFDRIVMGRGAYLLYPFVGLGLVPEAGSSLLLGKLVGELNARKILLDPARITAEDAWKLNLATDLCDEGQAFSTSIEIGERMSRHPRMALAATKRLMRGDRTALRAQVTREFEAFAERLRSEEARALLASARGSR